LSKLLHNVDSVDLEGMKKKYLPLIKEILDAEEFPEFEMAF